MNGGFAHDPHSALTPYCGYSYYVLEVKTRKVAKSYTNY